MEYEKPRRSKFWENHLFESYPWTAKVWDKWNNSCQANFKTLDDAVIWAANYVFDVPSYEEVSGNGRWGCD
jgi:hypothetical protein